MSITSIMDVPFETVVSFGTVLKNDISSFFNTLPMEEISIVTPPLDTFTSNPILAYSVTRRLSSNYTGPIIRLLSNGIEEDFGTDNNTYELNQSDVLTFSGNNLTKIVKIYDQSGKGYDWVAPSAAQAPWFVESGVINKVNGKPAARFPHGQATCGLIQTVDIRTEWNGFANQTQVIVVQGDTSKTAQLFTSHVFSGNSWFNVAQQNSTSASSNNAGSSLIFKYQNANTVTVRNRGQVFTALVTNSQRIASVTLLGMNSTNWPSVAFGAYPSFEIKGYLQEHIMWKNGYSGQNDAINNAINEFYNAY